MIKHHRFFYGAFCFGVISSGMTKKIMGLDVSSSTVGLSLLTQFDGYTELTHVEYYKPSKEGTIFERLSKLKSYINKNLNEFKPDEVIIEDILLGMSGQTSINTISLLAIFNRTVGLIVYESLNKSPILYSPREIRKSLELNNIIPSKEQVPEFLEQHMNIKFPWIKKKNKKTGKEKIIIENYDMSDAIGCAYCYILKTYKPDVK